MDAEYLSDNQGQGSQPQTPPKPAHPISDWKDRRLRVGWHLRNRAGNVGVVTWKSNNCVMYRIGTRDLNAH